MPVKDASGKARPLYEARQTRVPIPPFTDEDPSLGLADGYAIQRELVPMLLAHGDTVVGYKVGLTSKSMQRMIGIDTPDYGPVLASTVFRDGDTVPLTGSSSPRSRRRSCSFSASGWPGPGSP
jgi:2-keto-4-pentenoate hydratase